MTAVLPDTKNIFGPKQEDAVPVFVYGTLRVNEGNYMWARRCVVHEIEGAIARGQLFYVSGAMSFPVARFDWDGTIIGDVLWCDPKVREYREMVGMEIGAGYEMLGIQVQLPEVAGAEVIKAYGFQYLSEPRGERIMNGDWKNR